MKDSKFLPLTMAALIVILVLGVGCGSSSATATTPPQKATAAPRVTKAAPPAPKVTANATKDVLDDSQANSGNVTPEPGKGGTPTQDVLDDSSSNQGGLTTRTPVPPQTQASRPPTITLAEVPSMPSANDSTVWSAGATSDQVNQIKQYFSGRQVLFSWMEQGKGSQGTSFTQTIEHCGDKYVLRGASDDHAVAGNFKSASWRDAGSWDVTQDGDQIFLSYHSTTDRIQTVPVELGANGDVTILNPSLKAERQGPAVCE